MSFAHGLRPEFRFPNGLLSISRIVEKIGSDLEHLKLNSIKKTVND